MRFIKLLLIICLLCGCTHKVKEKANMIIQIEHIQYKINLENNDTVTELINKLPLELTMNELNGNEKYKYLDFSLPSDPKSINNIHRGDMMLFGDDCLVIFYKDFNTSYKYTRIGHIQDDSFIKLLGNKNIIVKLLEDKDEI